MSLQAQPRHALPYCYHLAGYALKEMQAHRPTLQRELIVRASPYRATVVGEGLRDVVLQSRS